MTEIRPMVGETQQNRDKEGDSVSPGHDSHLNKGKWKRVLPLWLNLPWIGVIRRIRQKKTFSIHLVES